METITKVHPMFDELKAICKCQSKDKTRYVLNYVFVDNSGVVAADGRVLAKINNVFGLTPGFYDITKCNKQTILLKPNADEKGKYPKYQNTLEFDKLDISIKTGHLTANLSIDLFKIAQYGVCINPAFLAIFEDLAELEYFVTAKDRPIHLIGNEGFHAVIMPIDPEYK